MAQQQPSIEITPLSAEIPGAVSRNISNHLALATESCELAPRRLRTLTDSFDEKISRAVRALGYYQASWNKQVETSEQCWNLKLELDLGEPVSISEVVLELQGPIADDPEINSFIEISAPRIGDQLNHSRYERFKRDLHNIAYSYGYADSEFTSQQMQVDLSTNRAKIELLFKGGARYGFGTTSFSSEYFNRDFLAKYQPYSQGQSFKSDLLTEFQSRLRNSRLFSDVAVYESDPDTASQQIPIEVRVTAVAKHVSSIGLGAATDTGPRASLAYENNRVNQRGHQYSFDISASSIDSSFNFGYRLPLSDPSSEQLRLKLGWQNEDTGTAENEIWFFGAAHSSETDSDWLRTVDLTYQVETYQVGEDEDKTGLLIPSVNWHRSRSNDLSYPTSGWRIQGGVRGGAEGVGSDLSFLQLSGEVKYILALGSGRLLSRLEAGSTLVDDTSDLPVSLRYFAGGDSSVRGFDYKSLGPRDDEDEVLGGKHLLTASIEYEHPISDRYGVALFYDVGNAFDDEEPDFEQAFGLGVRWRSPIGPIRLDLGFPQNSQDSYRLHLSMGPDL